MKHILVYLVALGAAVSSFLSEDDLCEWSEDGSITTNGKLRLQSMMFTNSSNCIISTSYGQEAVPVFLGGDKMSYDPETGVTTFRRDTVKEGMEKGRSEMNFCFVKPGTLAGFNEFQLAYLSATKQLMNYCQNSVSRLDVDTISDYGMEVKILMSADTEIADSVIAQWHGRPRRTAYIDTEGRTHFLPDVLSGIDDADSLAAAMQQYEEVALSDSQFSQGGYPPVAVKIDGESIWVQARYDPRVVTEKKPRCGGVGKLEAGETKKCGAGMELSVVHRESLGPWINEWKSLRLQITWGRVHGNEVSESRIVVSVDGEEVADWTGMLGRNDEVGSYMKYGIYATNDTKNFQIEVKNAYSHVDNE